MAKRYLEVSKGIHIEVDVDISQEEIDRRVKKWKEALEKSKDQTYNPREMNNYTAKKK